MIMITTNLKGGLGNQLFQICNLIAYCYENKEIINEDIQFWFLYTPIFIANTNRTPYWNSFFIELQQYVYANIPENIKNTSVFKYNEPFFEYKKIPTVVEKELYEKFQQEEKEKNINIELNGYFQSNKYFEKYKDKIFNLIKIKEKQTEVCKNIKNRIDFENTISLHFRLGDYKQFPDIHPIVTYKYYVKSIYYILKHGRFDTSKKINILYFHENNIDVDIKNVKNIISHLKHIYKNIQFIDIHELLLLEPSQSSQSSQSSQFSQSSKKIIYEDWEELLIMSKCNSHIIPNSTFSWWGAYFNDSENKIVTYPNIWFGVNCSHNTKDLCPETWNCVEC